MLRLRPVSIQKAQCSVRFTPRRAKRLCSSASLEGREPGGLKGNGVIGIRREDKSRWERRVPLAPQHVSNLVGRGVKVIIQPSPLRIFPDEDYKRVGAIVQEDLTPATAIFGVKEVPRDKLIPDRTYMFFSHTIKAQNRNMPMLDTVFEKNIRLIDYERVVDENNNRIIRFGKFAGYAGLIDFLHLLGDRLLGMGYSTPFLHIGFSHMYSNLESAMGAVFSLGRQLLTQKLPKTICPLVFVFTGTGSVTSGALEIFKLLPHKFVKVDELQELFKDPDSIDRSILYGVIADSESYMVPKDKSKKFNKREFYANPEKYTSEFAQKIAPYMSVMVNGTYWDIRYDRLLTTEQIEHLERTKQNRLIGVAELSCDVEGAIEFMKKTTTIDNPFFMYDVNKRRVHNDIEGSGIIFLGVDNLPSELPKEASLYFGDHLLPFVEQIAWSDGTKPIQEQHDLPKPIYSAVITSNGKLTPSYEYIADLRKKNEVDARTKRILILGSGLVSVPCIEYLSRYPRNQVTVASIDHMDPSFYKKFSGEIILRTVDVNNKQIVSDLVRSNDIIISLVPASMHVDIARECIKHKKHMVTASYISPEMQKLDAEAKKAGITILNEIGLDPGLDHLSAMKIIEEVHEEGGKINSFISWCGGLPAPECSDNPLAYKFSWSPRGVLLAGLNGAKYKWKGKVVEIPQGQLFNNVMPVDVYPAFSLEGLPNRDSLMYQDIYGIPEAQTMFRGTLRYKGFSRIMKAFIDLNLLNQKNIELLDPNSAVSFNWSDFLRTQIHASAEEPIREAILKKLNLTYDSPDAQKINDALDWFGMYSQSSVSKKGNPLDTLCHLLKEKLAYSPKEKDCIILHHEFQISKPDGTREQRTSTLVEYGEVGGYSAMSRTVAYPVAMAAKLILDGVIIRSGVLAPTTADIYTPLLSKLEKEVGIAFNEKSIERH